MLCPPHPAWNHPACSSQGPLPFLLPCELAFTIACISRWQSVKGWTFDKVAWYRTGASLMAEWKEKHPGRTLAFDTGGVLRNLLLEPPGWRAREGFGQPALGVPGEPNGKH